MFLFEKNGGECEMSFLFVLEGSFEQTGFGRIRKKQRRKLEFLLMIHVHKVTLCTIPHAGLFICSLA